MDAFDTLTKVPDYSEFIELMDMENVIERNIGSYDGELLWIVRDAGTDADTGEEFSEYAFATTSYGSCGGCDILADRDTPGSRYYPATEENWTKFREEMRQIGFDIFGHLLWRNFTDMGKYLAHKDWQTESFASDAEETNAFLEDCDEFFGIQTKKVMTWEQRQARKESSK